jgi:uncharacterized protein DUF4388
MLSGNLELFALADVLRFVARSGATGAVNVYRPAEGGRILLSEGVVVGASVDGLDAADSDGVVEAGLRLMDGGGGDFALDIEPVAGPVNQTVEDFLKTIASRRAEWRKIVAAVGSLDEPLVVDPQLPGGTTEVTLSSLEWQIAVAADGQRSIRELAGEFGTSAFAIATALLAMSNAGLLGLHGSGGAVDVEDSGDSDEESDESGFAYADDDSGDEDDLGAGEEDDDVEEDVVASSVGPSVQEDLDPADLLRELGEQQPAAPRARRLTSATRQEQRLRLRAR